MLISLIETQRKIDRKQLLGVGFLSVAIHTVVIAGAVYATTVAGRSDATVKLDTTLVLLASAQQQKPPEQQPARLDAPLRGFQTVVVPPAIPSDIPPVDLHEHFDPKDYSGTGLEGGHATGLVPDDGRVYAAAIVDQPPALLSAPPPVYPDLLKQAGIQGRVVLQAVVDTTGRVEPGSIKLLRTPNRGFDEPTRQWVLKALFRPARLQGRLVRVLVNLPLDYSLAIAP